MFARPCVAPPWPDPPASPVDNHCAQWNRDRQWNAQRTQREEVAKLKAQHASCIVSSNESIKTIAGTGAPFAVGDDAVRFKTVSTSKFPFIREITGNFLDLMHYRLSCRRQKSSRSKGLGCNSLCNRNGNFLSRTGTFRPSQREILARKREISQETGNSRNAM
jgi:hypothetical protein